MYVLGYQGYTLMEGHYCGSLPDMLKHQAACPCYVAHIWLPCYLPGGESVVSNRKSCLFESHCDWLHEIAKSHNRDEIPEST